MISPVNRVVIVLCVSALITLTGCIFSKKTSPIGQYSFTTLKGETIFGEFYDSSTIEMLWDADTYLKQSGTLIAEWTLLSEPTPEGLALIQDRSFFAPEHQRIVADIEHGEFHGDWILLYKSGKLKCVGKMHFGEPSGKWKWFTEDGVLEKLEERGEAKLSVVPGITYEKQ